MTSRRVVRLSRVDRERLEAGDISCPEEAVHKDDPPAKKTLGADRKSSTMSSHDKELLRELPPHFGKL